MKNLETLKNSDFIIVFAKYLQADETLKQSLKDAKNSGASVVYMHAVDSLDLKDFYTQFIKYEAGSEEGVCALLLDAFVKNASDEIQEYIDDLDVGYISAESSVGEEEFEEDAFENLESKSSKVIVVGEDILLHERANNILKLLKVIEKYTDFELILPKEISLDDENLEEVEELLPFNGTVVYSCKADSCDENLYASNSFARIAKVKDGDKIKIQTKQGSVNKTFKIDESLQSTIAVCKLDKNDESFLSKGYIYKPVKIERLEE